MNISEIGNRNHGKLFPELQVTDPEFIEMFDNFGLDEVLGYDNATPQKSKLSFRVN